jgi:UDP:flavonoid glycosyltransferase YjiC (YdhE family)
MLKVWVRRGSIKKNSKNIPVESIGNFDVVIRPGDSGRNNFDDELAHNIPIVRTNPILFQFNGDESLLDIRGRLGIPEFATMCYLQLGAGNINDIESEISMTLTALESHEHVFTVVGESMIGERISTTFENVRILRDYPNSRFFDQFDFAVIAGGYNSYHEVIEAELPSICYPNLSTGRDDQLARAMIASEAGAMIVLKERSERNIALSISRIIDPSVRKKMVEGMIPLKKPNGSMEAALWLKDQLSN